MPTTSKKSTRRPSDRARRARAPKTRPVKARPKVVPDQPPSPFRLTDREVESALMAGTRSGELENLFGEAEYHELRQLVSNANRRTVRGGPRVLILPGIMGSKLGHKRLIFDDVIWFDPLDYARGNLSHLALPRGERVTALGVFQFTYLRLKLRLRAAGYDVDYHPFDWRRDIAALGKELAQRVAREPSPVHLVAHSMGGLVARAAMKLGATVKRLVMLGTPNHGSFSPVMALRGTHDLVRKLARFDLSHTPEELSSQIFGTFLGLYQMLPTRAKFPAIDFFDAKSWPTAGPQPRAELLAAAAKLPEALLHQSERMHLIAGINQDTIVGAHPAGTGEFTYETSSAGDGTVPLDFARLDGVSTHYVEEEHGSLPNHQLVAEATDDLLRTGRSDRLPTSWSPARRATARIEERGLRIPEYGGRRGDELSMRERREVLASFAAPTSIMPAAPEFADPAQPAQLSTAGITDLVVGRKRQRRLELRLARGSITGVNARAYVVGIFQGVTPTGAANALDRYLGGAIAEFSQRRMFSANIGEVFIMPASRHGLRTEMVILVGLGHFDHFTVDTQQTVAENLIRTLVRTRVDDFATVAFGGGAGIDSSASLAHLLTGFLRGLADADTGHDFRRLTLCELDPERFAEMRSEVLRLATTPLFGEVEVTLGEQHLVEEVLPAGDERGLPRAGTLDPIYLQVHAEEGLGSDFRVSLLGAGAKATVITGLQTPEPKALDSLYDRLEKLTFAGVAGYGNTLRQLTLTSEVANVLKHFKDRHLIVVNDAISSRLPWETLCVSEGGKDWFPAAEAGLSRRYLADNMSVAKYLHSRRQSSELNVLLVINPTGDLNGAEVEGTRLQALFEKLPSVRCKVVRGDDASRARLMSELRSGVHDVVHYAGHASFDAAHPGRSGLLCSGHEVLGGADLAALPSLPSLVFFNACETGRLRSRGRSARKTAVAATAEEAMTSRVNKNIGVAEALLRGGIANYVGTYWPVSDQAAEVFAGRFYRALLAGDAMGSAVALARQAVKQVKSVDWADYIHYGDQSFRLKTGAPRITPLATALS